MVNVDDGLKTRLGLLCPHLDERQRRLLYGAEAKAIGRGGLTRVATAAGVSVPTVRKGLAELSVADGAVVTSRVRAPGAGRRRAEVADPGLMEALEALVSPETRGDPESLLRWTSKSLRNLAAALSADGHKIGYQTVGERLHEMGYSLQGNIKVSEGTSHPDRDAQFGYINTQAIEHVAAGQPVISVDTKKKELVGNYLNKGREVQPKQAPVKVDTYDFVGAGGRANPYGVYDVTNNEGWVSVGCDHDTSAFAVETIRRWWYAMGTDRHPDAVRLLICADGGGSNGSRVRAWKVELADLATELGMPITVCHFPPGTSKWNKIEHRMFSHISMNWRGKPLTSHEVIVELIAATTTTTGLTINAGLDNNQYPIKIKIPPAQMKELNLHRHDFHGDWNYTLQPETTST